MWNCAGDEQDQCSQIRCSVVNLNRAQTARITIASKADLRTFTRRVSYYKYLVYQVRNNNY